MGLGIVKCFYVKKTLNADQLEIERNSFCEPEQVTIDFWTAMTWRNIPTGIFLKSLDCEVILVGLVIDSKDMIIILPPLFANEQMVESYSRGCNIS